MDRACLAYIAARVDRPAVGKKRRAARSREIRMKELESALVAFLGCLVPGFLLFLLRNTNDAHSGTYRHAAVAADTAECSQIGVEILRKGGTAVDAAVAGLICSGVVNPQSAGIGGGGFMVYYNATSQESTVIDFRERAPRNITAYEDSASSTEYGEYKQRISSCGVCNAVCTLPKDTQSLHHV